MAPHQTPSPGSEHVQFATYRDHSPPNKLAFIPEERAYEVPDVDQWTPLPLQTWFWVSYMAVLALGAAGLEVALHFSKKSQGPPQVLCPLYKLTFLT